MAADRSLTTLLRALQRPSGEQDATRLLGSATTLLTLLSNPLNVTLLTSQLLSAPAIWHNPEGLQTSLRILSVVNTASLHLKRNEADVQQNRFAYPTLDGLDRVDWARAVARGADDRSPRWRHLLVLGGLLVGFENHERHGLPKDLRHNLEASVVDAANIALLAQQEPFDMAAGTICLVLGHVLDLLNDTEKLRLRHDLLLPLLVQQLLHSNEGLQYGYFLGIADSDVRQVSGQYFNWSTKSTSFYQLQRLAKAPLVSALGAMAQLLALCIQHTPDPRILTKMVEDMAAFTRSLTVQWRQNKLSEVDTSEEDDFLDEETRLKVLPLLWLVLRSIMFAVVVALRSLLGRVLGDENMLIAQHSFIAIQTLHTLRNIYFISSRLGHHAFSQYTFVYMTAIDVLSKFPSQAEAFLSQIRPKAFGRISEHPHDRNQDLFFFNTSEHFALTLSPAASEALLLEAAKPYLETSDDSRLMDIFEAAHSVALSVFSVPRNCDIVVRQLPHYISVLLASFPQNLSPQQFRLAIRTLVKIASPPNPISQDRPLLASTILEIIHFRFQQSSEAPLPSRPRAPGAAQVQESLLTEQAVMLLTLIDSFSALTVEDLEMWLPIAADSLRSMTDGSMQIICRKRFWEALSNGEMDVPRVEVSFAWWNTRGGREDVLGSAPRGPAAPMMSGALPELSKL